MPAKRTSRNILSGVWTAKSGETPAHAGTLTLGRDSKLDIPFFSQFDDIPPGTESLWGITDGPGRWCSVCALPFNMPGTWSGSTGEQHHFSEIMVRYALFGSSRVDDPKTVLADQITFTPTPDHPLRVGLWPALLNMKADVTSLKLSDDCDDNTKSKVADAAYAYFMPADGEFGPIDIGDGKQISYCVRKLTPGGKNYLSFSMNFESPHTIPAAVDACLQFCAFLSFITHTYVYPKNFRAALTDHAATYVLAYDRIGRAREELKPWSGNCLALVDKDADDFSSSLKKWYLNNEKRLRGRYLYRNVLNHQLRISTESFLWVFQAVEGLLTTKKHVLLDLDKLDKACDVLSKAFPDDEKIALLVKKIKSTNNVSTAHVLKLEIPELFNSCGVQSKMDVDELVSTAYAIRNANSHGGSHGETEFAELHKYIGIMGAIYLLAECRDIGLNPKQALAKYWRSRDEMHPPIS